MLHPFRRLSSDLFDADIVIQKIIWLAASSATPVDEFKELCDGDPEMLLALMGLEDPRAEIECESCDGTGEIHSHNPKCMSCSGTGKVRDENEALDAEEVLTSAMHANKYGFLIQVATPVRVYEKADDTIYRSGWGHYHTGWLYVDALDETVFPVLTAWAEKMEASDRRKAGLAINSDDQGWT